MLFNNQKNKLNTIFNVNNEITESCSIAIKKNSLTVGKIELINNITDYKDNTNYFYLSLINKSNNINYFYYLLKYYQNIFIENSFKNKSVGLSKSFLESFDLFILLKDEQEHLISICDYFYKQIEILEINSNNLKETNIISLIV